MREADNSNATAGTITGSAGTTTVLIANVIPATPTITENSLVAAGAHPLLRQVMILVLTLCDLLVLVGVRTEWSNGACIRFGSMPKPRAIKRTASDRIKTVPIGQH